MTNLTDCYGFNNSQELANKTDFDTNYKSGCVQVNDLENMETTFTVLLTYTEFKVKIDGTNIKWTDVKLEIDTNHYDLYLLTTESI